MSDADVLRAVMEGDASLAPPREESSTEKNPVEEVPSQQQETLNQTTIENGCREEQATVDTGGGPTEQGDASLPEQIKDSEVSQDVLSEDPANPTIDPNTLKEPSLVKSGTEAEDEDKDVPSEDPANLAIDPSTLKEPSLDKSGTEAEDEDKGVPSEDPSKPAIDPSTLKEPSLDQSGTEVEDEDKEGAWTDILGSGHLKKKVIKKGQGMVSRPSSGFQVTLKIDGQLEDGTVVDHNKELKFTLGDGDVIQALDLAVALMELEEEAEIYTNARFAYGDIGREPDIPKDSSITYHVELLKVENPVNISKLSATEKFTVGDQKRERGNYLYSRAEYSSAINSYKKALNILEDDTTNSEAEPSQLQQLIDTRIKCYSNLAAAQLKIEAYDAVIKSCDSVLSVHPQNVKALFRRGKALAAKGETSEAINLLRKALNLEPETKIIHCELSKLVNRKKKEQDKAKAMYRKMLGTDNIDQPPPIDQTWYTKWSVVLGASAAALLSVGYAAYKYRFFPG